jgi:adenylate kinase
MIKIVQIKGSNGSGKTTIVKQMIKFSSDVGELDMDDKIYATTIEDYGWVAIGRYPDESKMGGCDTMKTIEDIKRAIWRAHVERPDYWIVFEGMMISTIKSTFYNLLMEMKQDRIADPCFVILKADVDVCVRNINGRGTRRDGLNVDNVANKCELVVRHALTYDPKYVKWMDVKNIPLDRMAIDFLALVGDMRMAEDMLEFE